MIAASPGGFTGLDYTMKTIAAGLEVIRTFLSFTLQLETTGRWPWQKQI